MVLFFDLCISISKCDSLPLIELQLEDRRPCLLVFVFGFGAFGRFSQRQAFFKNKPLCTCQACGYFVNENVIRFLMPSSFPSLYDLLMRLRFPLTLT